MEKVVFSITDVVKEVAKDVDLSQKRVRDVIDSIEAVAKRQLCQANEEMSVEVKLIPGLTLVAEYVAPHEGRNPATGETVAVAGKNRCKAKIGTGLNAAVNA